jgi:hypothetical protein
MRMTNNITYKHKDLYDLLTDKTPPNVPDYEQLAFPIPPGVEMELVGIEKNELKRLKTREKEYLEQFARSLKLANDCITLARKLLQVKPELRGWLETNYKEYL